MQTDKLQALKDIAVSELRECMNFSVSVTRVTRVVVVVAGTQKRLSLTLLPSLRCQPCQEAGSEVPERATVIAVAGCATRGLGQSLRLTATLKVTKATFVHRWAVEPETKTFTTDEGRDDEGKSSG